MKLRSLLLLCLPAVFAQHEERVRGLKAIAEGARQQTEPTGVSRFSRQLFVSTLVCRFSPIDLSQLAVLFGSCFCRERELVRAIAAASTDAGLPTRMSLCGGEIELNEPIDITGKAIILTCDPLFFIACELSGRFSNRIFQGSPELLMIDGIILKNGNADVDDDDINDIAAGGALFLTGGMTILSNTAFDNNQAGGGGAIYVGPEATLVTEPDTNFFFNRATQRPGRNDRDGNLLPSGGGAILAFGALVTMEGGWFFENSAEGLGGAVYGDTSSIIITDMLFDQNRASDGGAIAANATIYQLFQVSFLENFAGDGNDVFINDDGDANTVNGSFVFCDQARTVSFCFDFLDDAIAEVDGGMNVNTNCMEEGLDDFDGVCDEIIVVEAPK